MLKPFLLFGTFVFLFIFHDTKIFAQQKEDTVIINSGTKSDTIRIDSTKTEKATKKKFNPRVATLRSAIIPGWGQLYNKKYWKIPIVYGALGTTAGVFFFNLKYYKLLRQAVKLRLDTIPSNDNQVYKDFINLSTQSIISYRNEFRQNIDYSVLVFLIFWGLNVVDATVDAHLKGFDVSPDVSMKIRPGLNSFNNGPGISFIFFLNNNQSKAALPLP